MHESVRQQRVMVDLFPEHRVAKAFIELAETLVETPVNEQAQGTLQFFWKQFLGVGTEVR
jgi:flagellar biosynthesis protein FlhG